MKVLHLIDRYLPPSQVWFYNLLTNTSKVQHHIATNKLLPHDFYHPDFRFLIHQRGGYRCYLRALDKGWFINKLIRLSLLPLELLLPKATSEMDIYLQKHEISLVHIHFAPYACEYLDWLERLSIPYVVSFYGYDYEKAPFDKPQYGLLYQRLFQSASAILCEGPHGIKILHEAGCPEHKLHCIPLGIDLTKMKTPACQTRLEGELKLLQIADFTPKKGQLDSIAAAILAKEKLPKLSLTLVGNARDETYFQQCQNKIKEAGAGEWIQHIPFVAYDDLPALISQYDVFIHPSKYAPDRDCEGGAPTILFNVQAMGMPVISTLHCDIPNVVQDGVSGKLVPENQPADLAGVIQYFAGLSGPAFSEWQQKTASWGREKGNIEIGYKALQTIYQYLIERNGIRNR